ncbi:hypothetical protein N9937_01935 [bacterium]|nr:hypothetical protein [bacterium]
MEERIEKLEKGHAQLQKAIEKLTLTIDKMISANEHRVRNDEKIERSLANIDNNVSQLRIDFERIPHERDVAVNKVLSPAWESIRKHDTEFQAFKLQSEQEHERIIDKSSNRTWAQVRSHFAIMWAAAIIISLVAIGYVTKEVDHFERQLESVRQQHISELASTKETCLRQLDEVKKDLHELEEDHKLYTDKH